MMLLKVTQGRWTEPVEEPFGWEDLMQSPIEQHQSRLWQRRNFICPTKRARRLTTLQTIKHARPLKP